MNKNLLTKMTLPAIIALSLSACGGSDDDGIDYENLSPVTVDGDLNIVVDEGTDIQVIDMLMGVTNPEDTPVYTREFTYYKDQLDENGDPIIGDDGLPVPNFEGPSLPFSSVYKSVDYMFIDTEAWNDLLVHPYTADMDEMAFSQGVYRFSYILDNGAEEQVYRNVTVTVNGVEDVVEDIVINHSDMFSVAKGYTVQLNTTVLPLNATFQTLTYETSDASIASISPTGLITGVEYGEVEFTVTSADGLVSKTISAVVEDLKDPLGVDVLLDGEPISALDIEVESSVQLTSRFVPDTIPFDNTVSWTSSDPSIADVDENGLVTAYRYDADNPELNQVTITATINELPSITNPIPVTVGESSNLLYSKNYNFESGAAFPWDRLWSTPAGGTFEVTEAAANTGMYGLHIVNDGSNHSGFSLSKPNTPQDVGEGLGRKFRFSYDIKNNNHSNSVNPDGSGVKELATRFYVIPPTWGLRIERWHMETSSSEWQTVEIIFDEVDWTTETDNGWLSIQFIKGPAIDVYIDNIKLEVVEEPAQ